MTTQDNSIEPPTVDQARAAVERSRERISRTLDRLEDRIVDKKYELQDRADVFRPVKQQVRLRPLTAIAIGFGVGVVLGSLSRGRQGGRGKRLRGLDRKERRQLREWREQRRERLLARADTSRSDGNAHESRQESRFDGMKGQLVGAVTTALTAAITSGMKDFVRDRSRSRADTSA